MVQFTVTSIATILAFAMTATAIPAPLPVLPDPAGAQNKGNQANGQFIGGECINSIDCALGTACCATLGSIGVCSGLQADFQNGKSGCGFGDNLGNNNGGGFDTGNGGFDGGNGNVGGGVPTGNFVFDPNAPGGQNVGTGAGTQFITGQCISDFDCASACCADGKCAAAAVVNSPEDPRTCGFVGSFKA